MASSSGLSIAFESTRFVDVGVTRAGQATATASAELVAGYGPELLVAARFLMRNEEDARDLAQTTLELGLRHIDDLRDPARVRAWLFAIEAREASRWRRRLRAFLPLGEAEEVSTGLAGDVHSLALRQALRGLPRQQRTGVVLHHLVGLTVEETGAAMNVSPNTVKTHLRLGLQALRESLDD